MDDERFALTGFDTLAVRAGNYRSEQGEHSEALFLTSSFVLPRLLKRLLVLAALKKAIFTHALLTQRYVVLKSAWRHWKVVNVQWQPALAWPLFWPWCWACSKPATMYWLHKVCLAPPMCCWKNTQPNLVLAPRLFL